MYTKLTLFLAFFFFGFINSGFGQCSSGQTSTTFSPINAIEQWTVPDGVTAITIIATGADGGNSADNGGTGATATATFAVTPGEILDVAVGIAGSTGNISVGGGGGGGSGVRRNSDSSILLVAGAGGGGNIDGPGHGGASFSNSTLPLSVFGSFSVGGGPVQGGFGAGGGQSGLPGSGPGIVFAGGGGGYFVPVLGFVGTLNLGGPGGISFIDASNISSLPIEVGVDGGGTESTGSMMFCYTLPQAAENPIPTMSQWGLMIFGLLIINLGVVFLRRKEEILV